MSYFPGLQVMGDINDSGDLVRAHKVHMGDCYQFQCVHESNSSIYIIQRESGQHTRKSTLPMERDAMS